MKDILLTLVIFGLVSNLYAQEKDFGIPQRPIKPVVSVPIFLDSANLKNDIRKLGVLNNIYKELKKKSFGAVYQYSFYVDTTGKTILSIPEKKTFLLPINKYVESIFLNYRWKPAYRLDCKDCLVRTFGILSFVFNTDDNYFTCIIRINNEREYKIFNEKINMR